MIHKKKMKQINDTVTISILIKNKVVAKEKKKPNKK